MPLHKAALTPQPPLDRTALTLAQSACPADAKTTLTRHKNATLSRPSGPASAEAGAG